MGLFDHVNFPDEPENEPIDPLEFVVWAYSRRGGLQLMANRIRNIESEMKRITAERDAARAQLATYQRREALRQ